MASSKVIMMNQKENHFIPQTIRQDKSGRFSLKNITNVVCHNAFLPLALPVPKVEIKPKPDTKSNTKAKAKAQPKTSLRPIRTEGATTLSVTESKTTSLNLPLSALPYIERPKQKIIYDRETLISIGKRPICWIPPLGPQPADIIKEYNEEFAKLFKEESSQQEQPQNEVLLQSIPSPPLVNVQKYQQSILSSDCIHHVPIKAVIPPLTLSNLESLLQDDTESDYSDDEESHTSEQRKGDDYDSILSVYAVLLEEVDLESEKSEDPFDIFPNLNDWDEEDLQEFEQDKRDETEPIVGVYAEMNERRLETRQKQIDIGKNTPGYQNYLKLVPRSQRKRGNPQTPHKYQVCSKRSWDGQIRKWRRLLHKFDPVE